MRVLMLHRADIIATVIVMAMFTTADIIAVITIVL
ncbi:hypothetical protein B6N60_02258 [Richelia sinica FACHB-800]|uniref:Uncharacterized protein n=1 Tax=Richelia sinica FACHB-800 TaxID=1357546 RepID=A0A975T7E5_9NOST|nr:hypothetical protein B6N60_02258 [Richelia sinica FACHB-800]